MMTETLFESDNLNIRRFTKSDATFILELLNTFGWKQFIGDRHIDSLDDATNYLIKGLLLSYEQYGFGAWLVTLKSTGQAIGMCGLFKRDYLDQPDLGFAFLPGFEGRGMAYEASIATISYIKEHFDFNNLYATTTDVNLRSKRLLERCGFTLTGTVTPPDLKTLLLYTLIL
jgi:ribosomal-protein-alanine N-acetyltransferase